MTLSDCVLFSAFSAGILMLLVSLAIIERDKLAGMPSGVWLALRGLIWVSVLAAWFAALAACFGHVVAMGSIASLGVPGPQVPRTGLMAYTAGGAAVTLCVALAMTGLGVYLYRNLWQLGAVLPRLRRRLHE